jgi:hypothetical protein
LLAFNAAGVVEKKKPALKEDWQRRNHFNIHARMSSAAMDRQKDTVL